MKPYRATLAFALLLALLVVPCTPGFGLAVKYKTTGIYVDSAGGQHPWSINDAHTLIWEGQPCIPVGVAFTARSLSIGATDADCQADTGALDMMKSKGITDVVLKSNGPATLGDPGAWQKMIDYLEANDFTYGIELSDGPTEPLKGHLISPSRYRLEGPTLENTVTANWPGVDSAMYLVVSKIDNSVKTTGGAIVKNDKVTISLPEPLSANDVLIVYPRKAYKPVAEGGEGDLWSGFGEYRDRLIAFFKQIKLGPGMRFFLEPFTSKMDFTGEMAGFIPDSQGFRLGFEAYLTKKHVHEGSVNAKWGINDNLGSIEEAARLVPMWAQGRGATYVYDRASGKLLSIDVSVSQMWLDIIEYRDGSAQTYMNTIADTLHKQVANVPVIFKSAKLHRIYANPYGLGGIDGLAASAYGIGEGPVVDTAGPVYALAEESGKSTWFIASTGAAPGGTSGYPSEASTRATLDLFKEVGCKGFFVDTLVGDAVQLDWLKLFKDKIKGPAMADVKPNVIGFPLTPVTGAHVKRLAPNTWWLPTLRLGTNTYIGDGMSAYALAGEDRVYAWSSIGPKTITMKAGPTGVPRIEFPEGASVSKKKNGQYSLGLTDTPTVVRGVDITIMFPYETAEAEIERLSQAIIEADKAGLSVKEAQDQLGSAKTVIKKGFPLMAYGKAQDSLVKLFAQMGADVWIEGESSAANSFDGPVPVPGASQSLVLQLDTDQAPPLSPYTAGLTFDAASNASYEIWIAATPPSDGSPMSYNVEDTGWVPVSVLEQGTGGEQGSGRVDVSCYAPGLAWYKIGTANLLPGRHSIKFRADGRRSDGKYSFAIDAVVLSPRGFKPNGVVKPY